MQLDRNHHSSLQSNLSCEELCEATLRSGLLHRPGNNTMSPHILCEPPVISTVEAAYMGRPGGTGYSCLLYPLSLLSVVQLTGPGDRNMSAN